MDSHAHGGLMPPPLIRQRSTFVSVKKLDSQPAISKAWQMVQTMLAHSDTRSIFLFLMLNFTFMFVQFVYSLLSHSLDSIHMLLDCVALLVGLLASVMAKWPASYSFPYGLNKVESLSGFINGVLLIGISGGIVVEAIERMWRPVKIERVTELLVVSSLGLVVNLVGIVAFNHGHSHEHGHGHGHSHGHSHECDSHGHGHSHESHNHDGHENHKESDVFSIPAGPADAPQKTKHNENMHGLFLHILADTLGSVGVIVSTGLTYLFGWQGFDALASLFIAVLIFMSAVPLVTSSASSLLLSLTPEQEYALRNALNEVTTVPGVVGYSSPRFWPANDELFRGIIHVQIAPDADAAAIRKRVSATLCGDKKATDVFIQIERQTPNEF